MHLPAARLDCHLDLPEAAKQDQVDPLNYTKERGRQVSRKGGEDKVGVDTLRETDLRNRRWG